MINIGLYNFIFGSKESKEDRGVQNNMNETFSAFGQSLILNYLSLLRNTRIGLKLYYITLINLIDCKLNLK